MAVNNLLFNGDFETGTLDSWIASNASVTSARSQTGNFSALINNTGTSSLTQTVAITPGQSFQLLMSLSKIGFAQSPQINVTVTFLDMMNNPIDTGLNTTIRMNGIPNSFLKSWLQVYKVTSAAPANATQAKISITKIDYGYFGSYVLVDDVQLLDFGLAMTPPPGPTGPTGPFV